MGKRVWMAAAAVLLLAVLLPAAASVPRFMKLQNEGKEPQEAESMQGKDADGSAEAWQNEDGIGVMVENAEPAVTLETIRDAGPLDIFPEDPAYDTAGYLMYYEIMDDWDGVFDPYAMVTRGEAVTALYRLSGDAPPAESPGFSDVDDRCSDAAAWAAGAGIAQGTGDGRFGAGQPVSRGQLAVMLYRFAEKQDLMPKEYMITVALESYPDGADVPNYAKEALSWVLGNDIYNTIVGESILAGAPVSRLQMGQALVAMLSIKDDLAAEIHAEQTERVLVSVSRDNHTDIQAAIDTAAKRYGAVGLQVAVVENGELCDTYAYGWATRNQVSMTANHKMRVASISKVLVGISAMLLREEGIVDLDASIGEYWGCTVKNPYHPETPISLRTLLTHTSSLAELEAADASSISSVKARLQGSGFTRGTPGDAAIWNYNNYGFAVLGMTLELASNRHLDAILQERLFVFMSIDGAFASGDIQHTELLANLYRNGGEISRAVETQKGIHIKAQPGGSGIFFAGGMTISAADLGKLVGLMAADGRYEGVQLMTEESVRIMESRQEIPGGSYQAIPMRYRTDIYGRDGLYYHTGSAYGVFNCISYDPETGDGVVVLTVGASGVQDSNAIYSICADISQYIYNII